MGLLKFSTAGNVDDGKSTLIGQLLLQSASLPSDVLAYIQREDNLLEDGSINTALLTDGLSAEREQGITIDIAHKYFDTLTRKFVILDSPGHVEYTRNMISAASQSQHAVLVIDITNGVTEQTRRHAFIYSFMGVSDITVAINKIDLVNYDVELFEKVCRDFEELSQKLNFSRITYLPVSALRADNILRSSESTTWFTGPSLLEHLESVQVDHNYEKSFDMHVQQSLRSGGTKIDDFRGVTGTVNHGTVKPGDELTVLPSWETVTVKSLLVHGDESESANSGDAVAITFNEDVDISRGDLVTSEPDLYKTERKLKLWIIWLDNRPLNLASRLLIRNGFGETLGRISSVGRIVDVNELAYIDGADERIKKNTICEVEVELADEIHLKDYYVSKSAGSLLLIDESNKRTVAGAIWTQRDILKGV